MQNLGDSWPRPLPRDLAVTNHWGGFRQRSWFRQGSWLKDSDRETSVRVAGVERREPPVESRFPPIPCAGLIRKPTNDDGSGIAVRPSFARQQLFYNCSSSSPARPLRLVAQDIGFSVRRQGFDSPRGCYGCFKNYCWKLDLRRNFVWRLGFLRRRAISR